METVRNLIVGAGISGLATAAFSPDPDYLVLEADREIGGYCKTIHRDGFVWDYSGHFFHFKDPAIEAWLRARMTGEVRTVARRSLIRFGGADIDFPFQKNIHQLPRQDFIDCLVDLFFREGGEPRSFEDMIYKRYGRGIADKFLVPYNRKLYATDLDALDVDAMGRFFPHADLADIVRNMRTPDNAGYNATFTYPAGGAIEYVKALLHDLPAEAVSCGERVLRIDLAAKTAETTRRTIRWKHVISSAPLPALLQMCGVASAPVWSWNQVVVWNLGFDRKGPEGVHWMYFPDPSRVFYRVGWYDNIMGADRMSLYVEIGARAGESPDPEALRARVLEDLAAERIVDGHALLSSHTVTLDPAYVHITRASIAEQARCAALLNAHGVHSVGRYGGWTYCSIEDTIVAARRLGAGW